MNSSKWIWRVTAWISAIATVVLVVGFINAFQDVNGSYTEPSAAEDQITGSTEEENPDMNNPDEANESEDNNDISKEPSTVLPPLPDDIKITAIGDSLAKGTGDNTGEGYVRRSIQQLNENGRKSELLNNLAINGLTTEGLLTRLEDQGIRYALEKADLILLSIGGNDLFQGSGLVENGQAGAGEFSPEQLVQEIPRASERLKEILQNIRQLNPTARVIYIGLYHPFADFQELLIPGNIAVSTWNHAAQQIINEDPNMVLVPTFDLFQGKLGQYLSSDHFHPNGDGYQLIAERIAKGIL
ncbi:lysophospholipase [Paenibacillus lemnae]|uniref:Lysophospholipase n=1 Tax=Paenibacillus lemnae TaxID=1330551 RepID=A0A848MA99_PAELE|nr:lysophospholipase [Paenibacillus lemnae]